MYTYGGGDGVYGCECPSTTSHISPTPYPNPSPQVDAALDLSHTQNIGLMIKTHFSRSQFIVVSLKEGMFNNANVIFRTRFVDGVSCVSRTVAGKWGLGVMGMVFGCHIMYLCITIHTYLNTHTNTCAYTYTYTIQASSPIAIAFTLYL
ncbi:hypothetical protein EON63_14310 [archaeon]|nr:MAG: hypothetical protein EON63_14310 [archaeon]